MTNPTDPGAQDECATCGHSRWRHRPVDGSRVCTEYANCPCEGNFVELPHATRMARVIDAAGDLAHQFADFRTALQGTMQSLHSLHTAMQVAGLLPEEDQTEDRAGRHHADRATPACPIDSEPLAETISAWASGPTVYRHTDGTTHPDRSAELRHFPELAGTLADALDVPAAPLAGPSLDGLPRQAGDAALMDFASGLARDSCPTCWPRPCDPTRSMCRRNPDVTQSIPKVEDHQHGPDCVRYGCPSPQPETGLCDGCGHTDKPVKATDDGRALLCAVCMNTHDNLTEAVHTEQSDTE